MEIDGNVGVFRYQISVSKVRCWLRLLWSPWVWATGFPLSKTFGGVRTKPELPPTLPRTVVRWVYICITFPWISLNQTLKVALMQGWVWRPNRRSARAGPPSTTSHPPGQSMPDVDQTSADTSIAPISKLKASHMALSHAVLLSPTSS